MRFTGSFQTTTTQGRSSSTDWSGSSTRPGASIVWLIPGLWRTEATSIGGVTALELGRATARKPPFKYSALTRVGFSDTDAQGVVYYGRYLPYFDTARVEYHRHLGMLRLDEPHHLVMRASALAYHPPARFDGLPPIF